MAHPVLVAAPGMTVGEVVAASTATFKVPRDDEERGIIQPSDPCRVDIRHPDLGVSLPPGLYNVVDAHKGRVYRVMSTPQLDYLALAETIALIQLVSDAIAQTQWQPIETPDFNALPRGLTQRRAALVGHWTDDKSWVAELRVKQDLLAGSDEARAVGFAEGGFLTSLTVWDDKLWP